jgi:NAD(P)H-dependent FMN reductase
MVVIISCSLHPQSKSRILAREALSAAHKAGVEAQLIDLRDYPLPLCDGDGSYSNPNIEPLMQAIRDASAVLLASPIYNYDVAASTKNLIELVGGELKDKAVGMLCAAGGDRSYMAPLGLLNSLMLDFRSIVVPRFVYATGNDFRDESLHSEDLGERIDDLVRSAAALGRALSSINA